MSSATIAKSRHFKRECRALKKNQDGGNDNKNKDNNFVAMISEAFSLEEEKSWCVDSEATRHVCNDLTILKTYEPLYSMLYMGNHSTAQVKRKGKIDLVFTYGNTLTLNDVLHVPDVRKNLVSGSLLNKFGFKLVFKSDKFILSKGGKFVGKGYHTGEMFKLNIKDVVNSSVNDVNMTEISDANDAFAGIVTNNDAINKMPTSSYYFDSSLLWHARLGHVYFRRMRNMANANLIPKLDSKNDKCQTCMHTKITRLPFPTIQRSSKILELVHSDVCDLHATPTISGKKYFATFIDDYSRNLHVVLIVVVNTMTFDISQYTVYVHKVTAPYTPTTECSGYWGEALLTACYILNRVPSKRSIKTPYELWNQRTPKLDYLRIWRYLPPGSKAIKSKWIFKRKLRIDGSIEKFKARLVAKGFTQREGLDYFDTYATIARNTTIRILIALASINKLIIHQMDVKTAFLNGELEEEVYMEQPEDDMLIFGTDLEQVQMTKKLLSENFDMKDLGEVDVILGIKILFERNMTDVNTVAL
ncbi:zinc finger, CCHC-type containing protein [Tanacetum coccineum]